MKTLMTSLLLLTFAACAADEPPSTSIDESAVTCTPGVSFCDWGCGLVGGQSTNDCIVRCNPSGTGWINVQDCGWAQNFPYSSSCFDGGVPPVCQSN
jgi:hypothetical protein